MDEYNTAIRLILDSTFPEVPIDEDVILKIVSYCRDDSMMDPEKPKWYYPLEDIQQEDGEQRATFREFTILEVLVPHLYSILVWEGDDSAGGV